MRSFSYTPKDLKVKVGEPINLTLKSFDIDHTYTVKDLDIDWQVKGGATVPQTYTFTRLGSYRVICAIPGHESAGMVGSLQVQS